MESQPTNPIQRLLQQNLPTSDIGQLIDQIASLTSLDQGPAGR
jgi:hypothetical protein